MRTRGALIALALCALTGCTGGGAHENTPTGTHSAPATTDGAPAQPGPREAFAPPRAELPTALPDDAVALEVLSWGTSDASGELGDRLATLERRPEGEMAELAERLRRQGLRLVRLGAADAGPLFEIAPPTGAVRRRIVLPGERFEEVVDGATLEESKSVGTVLGARRVGPGSARLAARAWASVEADGTQRVRADLVGVMGALVRAGRTELLSGSTRATLRGEPIPGMSAHMVMGPNEAWAIVAASPDAVWAPFNTEAPPAPARTPDDPALRRPGAAPIGPRVQTLKSAGEALFSEATGSLVLSRQEEDARLIVLLVPRTPGRFTLFPERAPEGQ